MVPMGWVGRLQRIAAWALYPVKSGIYGIKSMESGGDIDDVKAPVHAGLSLVPLSPASRPPHPSVGIQAVPTDAGTGSPLRHDGGRLNQAAVVEAVVAVPGELAPSSWEGLLRAMARISGRSLRA